MKLKQKKLWLVGSALANYNQIHGGPEYSSGLLTRLINACLLNGIEVTDSVNLMVGLLESVSPDAA